MHLAAQGDVFVPDWKSAPFDEVREHVRGDRTAGSCRSSKRKTPTGKAEGVWERLISPREIPNVKASGSPADGHRYGLSPVPLHQPSRSGPLRKVRDAASRQQRHNDGHAP